MEVCKMTKVLYEGREYDALDGAFIDVVDGEVATTSPGFTSVANGVKFFQILVPTYVGEGEDDDSKEYETLWVHSKYEIKEDSSVDEVFLEQADVSPHLQDLGYSMVSWLDGLEARPDNDNLPPVVTLLMVIQYDKEGGYGSSWKGKGEYRGIMANIDRKYDRLDKMTMDEINKEIPSLADLEKQIIMESQPNAGKRAPIGESKIDAIADLANYCLLYMTYVKETYPNVFDVWVDKNIPHYLRDKIHFLQK